MIFMCINVLKVTTFTCGLWGWARGVNIGKHLSSKVHSFIMLFCDLYIFINVFQRLIRSLALLRFACKTLQTFHLALTQSILGSAS